MSSQQTHEEVISRNTTEQADRKRKSAGQGSKTTTGKIQDRKIAPLEKTSTSLVECSSDDGTSEEDSDREQLQRMSRKRKAEDQDSKHGNVKIKDRKIAPFKKTQSTSAQYEQEQGSKHHATKISDGKAAPVDKSRAKFTQHGLNDEALNAVSDDIIENKLDSLDHSDVEIAVAEENAAATRKAKEARTECRKIEERLREAPKHFSYANIKPIAKKPVGLALPTIPAKPVKHMTGAEYASLRKTPSTIPAATTITTTTTTITAVASSIRDEDIRKSNPKEQPIVRTPTVVDKPTPPTEAEMLQAIQHHALESIKATRLKDFVRNVIRWPESRAADNKPDSIKHIMSWHTQSQVIILD